MKATLSHFKQSPRKVRLVADVIRGKNVLVAQDALAFVVKKAAPELQKLLASAIASARMQGMNPEDLIVTKVTVDKGRVMRRFMPKARGRAGGIRKTMSHITIELGAVPGAKPKAVKKTAKKASKKKAAQSE